MHPADSYMSQSKNVWGTYTEAEILKATPLCMCVWRGGGSSRVENGTFGTPSLHVVTPFLVPPSAPDVLNLVHNRVPLLEFSYI